MADYREIGKRVEYVITDSGYQIKLDGVNVGTELGTDFYTIVISSWLITALEDLENHVRNSRERHILDERVRLTLEAERKRQELKIIIEKIRKEIGEL